MTPTKIKELTGQYLDEYRLLAKTTEELIEKGKKTTIVDVLSELMELSHKKGKLLGKVEFMQDNF